VGIATGVAVLGALYTSRVTTATLHALAGLPAPPGAAHRLAAAVASGAGTRVAAVVPPAARAAVTHAARAGTASALNDVLPPAPPPAPGGYRPPSAPRPRAPRSARPRPPPPARPEPASPAAPPRPVTATRPPSRPPPRTRPSDRPGPKQRHHSRIRTRRRLVSSPQVNIPEGRRMASGARRRSAFPRPVPGPGGAAWCDDREHGVRCRIGRRCRWRR